MPRATSPGSGEPPIAELPTLSGTGGALCQRWLQRAHQIEANSVCQPDQTAGGEQRGAVAAAATLGTVDFKPMELVSCAQPDAAALYSKWMQQCTSTPAAQPLQQPVGGCWVCAWCSTSNTPESVLCAACGIQPAVPTSILAKPGCRTVGALSAASSPVYSVAAANTQELPVNAQELPVNAQELPVYSVAAAAEPAAQPLQVETAAAAQTAAARPPQPLQVDSCWVCEWCGTSNIAESVLCAACGIQPTRSTAASSAPLATLAEPCRDASRLLVSNTASTTTQELAVNTHELVSDAQELDVAETPAASSAVRSSPTAQAEAAASIFNRWIRDAKEASAARGAQGPCTGTTDQYTGTTGLCTGTTDQCTGTTGQYTGTTANEASNTKASTDKAASAHEESASGKVSTAKQVWRRRAASMDRPQRTLRDAPTIKVRGCHRGNKGREGCSNNEEDSKGRGYNNKGDASSEGGYNNERSRARSCRKGEGSSRGGCGNEDSRRGYSKDQGSNRAASVGCRVLAARQPTRGPQSNDTEFFRLNYEFKNATKCAQFFKWDRMQTVQRLLPMELRLIRDGLRRGLQQQIEMTQLVMKAGCREWGHKLSRIKQSIRRRFCLACAVTSWSTRWCNQHEYAHLLELRTKRIEMRQKQKHLATMLAVSDKASVLIACKTYVGTWGARALLEPTLKQIAAQYLETTPAVGRGTGQNCQKLSGSPMKVKFTFRSKVTNTLKTIETIC